MGLIVETEMFWGSLYFYFGGDRSNDRVAEGGA
jgi:hypothetical protein